MRKKKQSSQGYARCSAQSKAFFGKVGGMKAGGHEGQDGGRWIGRFAGRAGEGDEKAP